MTQPNQNAFPYEYANEQRGLSKREIFAMAAMQGLLTEDANVTSTWILEKLELPKDTPYELKHYMMYVAKQAVLASDCLISELNKETK